MTTLTPEQVADLKRKIAARYPRPVATLYLDQTEQDRTDMEVFRCMLREVIGYMTGKLDLCEVSMVLSEVAEEFEEECAT